MHADSVQQPAKIRTIRSEYFISLKSKKRIDLLFKRGSKAFGRNLMLRFARNTEIDPPFQIVFAVASKLGDAHMRNRIKRRLREALYAILKTGKVKNLGFDLAIIPKKEVVDLGFAELVADLQSALKRLPRTTA